MATTLRYSCGARRRLRRSSSWQKKCRCASVEKSTKPKLTGFLILYAYGPVNTTHEMCVCRTTISVVGCSYTEPSVRAWISRSCVSIALPPAVPALVSIAGHHSGEDHGLFLPAAQYDSLSSRKTARALVESAIAPGGRTTCCTVKALRSKYPDIYFCTFFLSHPKQYQQETLA